MKAVRQRERINEIRQHPEIALTMMDEFASRIQTLAHALGLVILAIECEDFGADGWQQMHPHLKSILEKSIAFPE